LFIAAGMGGGTGTGAAPVIAKLAREKGILTVGVATKPFHFEGSQRMKLAEKGLEELQQYVDTLLVIPNQNLFRIANENTTFADAFKMADDVLYAGVRGVTDLMVQPGLINLDFSDVKTVMSEMGKAMMGTGEASGEGRSIKAAEAAIANPLIDDVSLKGAKGLIINITGGSDITLYEVDEAANRIKQEVDESANIIYGTTCDERLEGLVRVSLVATGIDVNSSISPKPLENIKNVTISNSVYKTNSENLESNVFESQNHTEIDNDSNILLESTEKIDDNQENNTSSLNEIASENLEIEKNNDLLEKNEHYEISEEIKKDDEIDEELSDIVLENDLASEGYLIKENDKFSKVNSTPISDENSFEENDIDSDEKKQKNSVRKLSLFDTLDDQQEENKKDEKSILENDNQKSEPIFQNQVEKEDADINTNLDDNFIESEEIEVSDDMNQDDEEELLDIPTFLRRQAN
jgi:cell division protein FtsZ